MYQVCWHLANHKHLTFAQHGFIQNRSRLTSILMLLVESIRRMHEDKLVKVGYLDVSGAFSCVSHFLADQKLPDQSITGAGRKCLRQFVSSLGLTDCVGTYGSASENYHKRSTSGNST